MKQQKMRFKHTAVFTALLAAIPMMATAQTLEVTVTPKTDTTPATVTAKTSGDNSTTDLYGNSSDGKTEPGLGQSYHASSNVINVSGENQETDRIGNVYGGKVVSESAIGAEANSNIVTLTNVRAAFISGGDAGSKGTKANSNTITVTLSDISGAYGGYTEFNSAKANGNRIEIIRSIIQDSSVKDGYFYVEGGYSLHGVANGNHVKLEQVDASNTKGNRTIVYGGEGETDASRNVVTIKTADGINGIYGGYADEGRADNNRVTVIKADVSGDVYGGYADDNGTANGNEVILRKSNIGGSIYGGKSYDSKANNNKVTVKKSYIDDYVYGGEGETEANNNEVTITDSDYVYGVYGGYADEGSANQNIVTVGNTYVSDYVYGGYADDKGTANNNVVTLTNTSNLDDVYGGYSCDAAASGNKVTITDGSYVDDVYGGNSSGKNAETDNNSVLIEGTSVDGYIYGGYSSDGGVSGNSVTIRTADDDGDIEEVAGGYAGAGDAKNNQVLLENVADVYGSVYGGYADSKGSADGNTVTALGVGFDASDIYGGYSSDGTASDNHIMVGSLTETNPDGTTSVIKSAGIDKVYGGYSANGGNTIGNTVTVADTDISGTAAGGYAEGGGKADNNKLTVTNTGASGNLIHAYGGYSGGSGYGSANGNELTLTGVTGSFSYQNPLELAGGYVDGQGDATKNTVSLTNVTYDGSSYHEASIYGGYTGQGKADDNKITITDSSVDGDIYGGYSDDAGTALRNTVSLTNVIFDADNIMGGVAQNDFNGDVSYNTVTIDKSQITTVRSGGWSPSDRGIIGGSAGSGGNGHVQGNEVIITDSNIDADIGGGYAYQADAIENNVYVRDTTFASWGALIYGGYSDYVSVVKNSVVLDHVTGEGQEIYGGYSDAVDSTGGNWDNSVEIKNGSVLEYASVYGGYADGGVESLLRNSVTVDNSHLADSDGVYGAYTDGSGQILSENGVTIRNGSAVTGPDAIVVGAYTEDGTVTNNKVVIDQSGISGGDRNDFDGLVYGAIIDGGGDRDHPSSASGNQVVIRNRAEINGAAYGSYTDDSYGYVASNNGNSISVSGDAFVNADVYGAYAVTDGQTQVSGNSASIDSARVAGNVYGAYSDNSDVEKNSALISGNSLINGKTYGAYTESGAANENTLTVAGGTLEDDAFAAYSEEGDVAWNKVAVSGGNIQKDIYGGYTENGRAIENVLTLSGTPEFGKTSTIYGGYSGSGDDALTGNSLYFKNYGGSAIYDIKNVENTVIDSNSNVTLSKNDEAIQLYRLTNNGNLSLSSGDNRTDGHLVIGVINEDGTVSGGYAGGGTITLDIDTATGKADTVIFNQKTVQPTANFAANLTNGVDGKTGAKAIQEYFDAGNPVYIAETQTEKANFTMKAIGNRVFRINRDAGMSMSQWAKNSAGESVESYGWYLGESEEIKEEDKPQGGDSQGDKPQGGGSQGGAVQEVQGSRNSYSKAGLANLAALRMNTDLFSRLEQTDIGKYGFAHIDYQNVDYDVSGNLDMNGKSIVVGTSFGENDKKNDTMGIFFEAGDYNYSASNRSSNLMSDTSSPTGFRAGKIRAHGDTNYYGLGLFGRRNFDENSRIEVVGRVGRIKSDYRTNSMEGSNFEIKGTYFGLSVGGIYSYPLDENKAIETFGKLYWTHVGSDSDTTKAGTKINVDSIDSLLGKIGARLVSTDKARIRPYAGIALEHEFSGDVDIKVDGASESSSIKDTTGSLELGLRGNSQNERWNYDFSVRGYTGAYDGYGLNFKVNYRFE